jgi:hypothetical protein
MLCYENYQLTHAHFIHALIHLITQHYSASNESHPLHAKQIAARRLSTRRALGEGCFPQLPTDEELAEAALKKAKSGALTTAVFSTWTVAAAVVVMTLANML